MVEKSDIKACFQELNIDATEEVLKKCLDLCTKYNLEAEEFCDQWYAYTASHLNGAHPTLEYLDNLERKEFKKNKDQLSYKKTPTSKATPSKLREDPEAITMVSSYTATTPKSARKPNPNISGQVNQKSYSALDNLPKDGSSPALSQTEKYSQRSDSRSVQCCYGTPSGKYKREKDLPMIIKNANVSNLQINNFKYMYEILGKKAKCLNNMTQWLGHVILNHQGLILTEGTLKNQVGDTVTYGRIVSDCDGKINAQSILLEGSLETNLGNTVTLILNKVPKYSLFPGQVVAVQGNNPNSTTFIAEKVFTDSRLLLPVDPPDLTGQLQIVVAAGPYTLQGSLMFEPLKDLVKYVTEYKPHVLILLGPFLKRNHDCILNGGLTQTLDSFFEDLIENVMNSLKDIDIQVIIVSSQSEAHHHPVYPTPPYSVRDKYSNLTFMPDPCMIDINGLVIGATSADILFHISNFEIYQDTNLNGPSDRMGRIASHLLHQHSFYPLYPPHKDICLDNELFEEYGILETKPHILILPSNLRHFIKNVEESLVINPERLTKGYVAGTFARIEVNPGSNSSICNHTVCEILRI